MTIKQFHVNKDQEENDDLFVIQRCPHDAENPYTMIKNDLLRDTTLSDGCLRLICYLLSNKNDWKITISQIVNHMKNIMGRTKVYDLVNEAIAAGYMKRETTLSKNLKSNVKYFVSETPKFNQTLVTSRYPDSRYTELRRTENHHTQEDHRKEEYQDLKTSLMVSSKIEDAASCVAAVVILRYFRGNKGVVRS